MFWEYFQSNIVTCQAMLNVQLRLSEEHRVAEPRTKCEGLRSETKQWPQARELARDAGLSSAI